MNRQIGFTLIELVLTMLLISILAVTVLPKLFGKSEFSPYAIRDQLISQLRLVQLQALNRRGVCHNLVVTGSEFGIIDNIPPVPPAAPTCLTAPADNKVVLDGVKVEVGGDDTLDLRFDSLGRVASIYGGGDCIGGCIINIVGSDTVQIKIEQQGYIHAL